MSQHIQCGYTQLPLVAVHTHLKTGWGLPAPKPPGGRRERKLRAITKEIKISTMVLKLDSYIKVRLSKQEKIEWQEKAARAGLPLSNLLRQAMKKTRTWTAADRSLISEQTREISLIGNNLNQIAKWANTYKSTAEAIEVIECLRAIESAIAQLTPSSSFPSAPPSETETDVS